MGRPWGTVVSPRITAVFRMSKCGYPSFENKNILCSKTSGIDKMVKMGKMLRGIRPFMKSSSTREGNGSHPEENYEWEENGKLGGSYWQGSHPTENFVGEDWLEMMISNWFPPQQEQLPQFYRTLRLRRR